MKQLYILLFLFVSSICVSQIITIPDANFKAKLLESNTTNQIASSTINSFTPMVIDANGNGEIEVSEALLVRWLNVSNSSIVSLEGISSFIGLQKLICNNNSLTNLDVNSLINLSFLDCSNNILNSLNAEQVDNTFKYFNCSFNNLTSLQLPNFYEYQDEEEPSIILNCRHNLLSEIVFSTQETYEKLTLVDISNNNFTTLSFTNIEILGALNLSNNPLTSIDFANLNLHSQHPDYTYGFLYLDNTLLNEIYIPFDISFGSSITNNPNLNKIYINNGEQNVECYIEIDENEMEYELCNGIVIDNNPNLNSVCVDSGQEEEYYQNLLSGVIVNSNCELSLSSFLDELFTLFPNPTKNSLNINLLSENEIQNSVIYNLLGQKLISSESQQTIDVSSLQQGTYLIEVETQSGTVTKRFIKN